MHRSETGALAYDLTGASLRSGYHGTSSGWYVQAVYQFIPRWRAGLRYDALQTSSPMIGLVATGVLSPIDFPALLRGSPDRATVMVDWNPSEFTRIRVQYALDDARLDGRDGELFIQYLYGIGAHGAHKF
jgi:outer membrane receptor protein involved in Fe transport